MKIRGLSFCILFLSTMVYAQETGSVLKVAIDGLTYKLNQGTHTAMVANSNSWEGELDIPEQVSYNDETYIVDKLEWLAFDFCKTLTKVRIPKTVVKIQHYANYEACKNPFRNCTSLESIEVDEANPSMCSVNGVLFSKDKTQLYCYPAGAKRETYSVPDGVKWLYGEAFAFNSYLTSIYIPNSVTYMAFGTFSNCKSLKSIRLSENIKQISAYTFECCESLHFLDFPESVMSFAESVFSKSPIKTIVIRGTFPEGLRYDTFYFMDDEVIIYVQPSEVEKFKKVFTGTVLPLSDWAQDNYRPLVEEGKHWTYDNYMPLRPAEYDYYYYYDLKGDTLIAGRQCLKMHKSEENDNTLRYQGALYEENKKVYCFFPEQDQAKLLYDFDCVVGDTIQVLRGKMLVKDILTEDNGGIAIKKYIFRYVSEYDEENIELFWIEGVGATKDFFDMIPLPGNYNTLNACELNGEKLYQTIEPDYTEEGYHKMGIEGKRWNYIHYHLEDDGWHEDPYSYVVKGDTIIRRTRYKKLYYQDAKTERFECLLYEKGRSVYKNTDLGNNSYDLPTMKSFFFFDRSDFGRVFTWKAENASGNTNWMVYGVDTIEVNNSQFRRYTCLQKYSEDDETLTTIEYDGEGVWRDIWVEGVGSASSGIEDQHPSHEPPIRRPGDYTAFVSCYENGECIFTADDFNIRSKDVAYRPFVEEGKVWKLGDDSGNPVKRVEYYYFDGDTIIDGKTYKQMMCQRYVSPDHPDYAVISRLPSLSKVGAWYEEDMKVYFYNTTNKQLKMMYDFSLEANDTLLIDNLYPYVIGPKQTGGLDGFKGVYRDVMWCRDGESNYYCTTWLEGVGGIDGPTFNIYYGEEGHALFLMSCSVGDEVIYLNDEYEDGATPDDTEAKKHRFDFTHTVKTQPRVPIKRVEEAQSLYGEYSNLRLGINLDPLDAAYQVRITNELGQVVYEKKINAGYIVALDIDISAYAEGRYTVTVENSHETFTGEFEMQTTGIEEVRNKHELVRGYIYNLQGQRISSLRKGLNIVNGKKIYVK